MLLLLLLLLKASVLVCVRAFAKCVDVETKILFLIAHLDATSRYHRSPPKNINLWLRQKICTEVSFVRHYVASGETKTIEIIY